MKKNYVFFKVGIVLTLFFQLQFSYSQNSPTFVIDDLAIYNFYSHVNGEAIFIFNTESFGIENSASDWFRKSHLGYNMLQIPKVSSMTDDITWVGTTNTDWATPTNWSDGMVPGFSSNVTVPQKDNMPIIASDEDPIVIANLIIDINASLTLDSGASLTINGDITNNGNLIVNSAGSLIAKNAGVNIPLTYKRDVTNNWHLISSPVNGQSINDFVTGGSNNIAISGTNNYGIGIYNSSAPVGSGWEYYNTTSIGSAGTFLPASGYAALRNSSGEFTFNGNLINNSFVKLLVDGTTNEWNLIGNPFPSYIAANSNASFTNNLLTTNAAVLDPNYTAIYFWDSNKSSYVSINQATESPQWIPPGQGFFVRAKDQSSFSLFWFNEEMQGHNDSNTFYKSTNNQFEIIFIVSNGTKTKSTDIRYIDGTTIGLDPGYDAGLYNGTSSSFKAFSHLISNSEGIDFGLQCLPNKDYEKMIIPIGVNIESDAEITITIESINIPNGLKIFLEDKVNNSFTRLDEINTSYVTNMTTNDNGIGRFYIHTSSQDVLSTGDNHIGTISIYKTDNHILRIAGLLKGQSTLKMYDILGKLQLKTSFKNTSVNDITIPRNINSGVYIIQLETSEETLNKKIIIE